jgi:hypothetical protein
LLLGEYMKHKTILPLLLLLMFFAVGCSQEESTSPPTKVAKQKPAQVEDSTSRIFLEEAVPLHRLERVGEALAVWRQYSEQQPALLLLSNYPLLMPVPDQLRDEVSRTVVSATADDLSRLSDVGLPAPLFLPEMTVDIALREGWFGQLAWAPSIRDPAQELSLEPISERFAKNQFASELELATLTIQENILRGTLRGVSTTMAALHNLPELNGPVIIHIDPGYFQGMYENEIATPILQVINNALAVLRERKIPVLAVTFDNSNLVGRISLDVRFLQHVLARMIESPETLDQEVPINWRRKADILYLSNFFKKDETRELALAMNADEPDTAWVKFALYRSSVEHSQGSDALSFLAEAVRLDRVYALEYLALSDMAYEKKRSDEAMRMLSLAAGTFPENAQIKLKMAHLATAMGDKETALHLVGQLQQLEWSPVYYPDMPQYLEDFTAYLKGETTAVPQPKDSPANDPRRQRILK